MILSRRIHHTVIICFFAAILIASTRGDAQQAYVSRYSIYTGFSDLYTPGLNDINQVGFHLQVSRVNTRWLSSGFDYSVQSGSTNLTANLAKPSLQQELALLLPPGYNLNIPFDATTQTFTAGADLTYRHFASATLFIRPSLAAFRIAATPHPTDPVAAIVSQILVPQGTKVDWVGAYGVGGGSEVRVSKHLGVRTQIDIVWQHPYNDILANGNWSYRFSVGPAFHFGQNVPAHQ